ncbi:hypothetical protein ACQP1W_18860 [Spirillospora sp. CA-255316]
MNLMPAVTIQTELDRIAGIEAVLTGTRIPRTDAVMERWVRDRRRDLLDGL